MLMKYKQIEKSVGCLVLIKRCKHCQETMMADPTSTVVLCLKCGTQYTYQEYLELQSFYKIVLLGKHAGENNFTSQLGIHLSKMGHDVHHVNKTNMFKYVHPYDMTECEQNKKPIPLRPLEYVYSPDFILVAQSYLRWENDCERTPVIYHHREYTHFADLLNPDMLLFGYPCREESYDMYHPYEYSKIKHKRNLFNGVNPQVFFPKEKTFKGITQIGWSLEPWRFQAVNGPFAYYVIEEQDKFAKEVRKWGQIRDFEEPVDMEHYKELIRTCEAVIVDGGALGWYTRRVFELSACKTVPVIRIFFQKQLDFYKKEGLIDGENCLFFKTIEDLKDIVDNIESRHFNLKEIGEKAYEWSKDHTYVKVAQKLINLYEELLK